MLQAREQYHRRKTSFAGRPGSPYAQHWRTGRARAGASEGAVTLERRTSLTRLGRISDEFVSGVRIKLVHAMHDWCNPALDPQIRRSELHTWPGSTFDAFSEFL